MSLGIIGNLVEFYEPYAAEKHIALASAIDAARPRELCCQ